MSISETKSGLQYDDASTRDGEEQPLLRNKEGHKTYTRRWYVLAVFSTACFMQACVWNTWGPITQSAEVVFGWKDSQIGMLANWGNIAYIITVFPACYFMDTKGLRVSFVTCTVLVFIGTGLRCITIEPQYATWMMNLCAILNGIAGTVPCAGPALIANTWFPPNQRTTATAISTFFNFGPQLVSSPKYKNVTHIQNNTSRDSRLSIGFEESLYSSGNTSNSSRVLINLDNVRHDIRYLMYYD